MATSVSTPDRRRPHPLASLALLLGLTLAAAAPAQGPGRSVQVVPPHAVAHRALLVGVSRYCPKDPACENNLPGPDNDVPRMRQALHDRFGFADSDITVLQDADAVKPQVEKALNDLAAWAAPGREIFIYFSGHGTSSQDPDVRVPLPDRSGALMLAPLHEGPMTLERWREQMLIGQSDVRPALLKMDQAGANVIAVIDACFSQNALRSAAPTVRQRVYRSSPPPAAFAPPLITGQVRPAAAPDSWPYAHVAWLAASSANEKAEDLDADQTYDHKPHGALTDALLRVLSGQAGEGRPARTYAELFDSTRAYMRSRLYQQTAQIMPSRLTGDTRAAQVLNLPVFGQGGPGAPHATTPQGRLLKVSLTGRAAGLRSLLAPLEGIQVTDENPDYIIGPPASGPSGWSFATGRKEPVLTDGRKQPLTQDADTLHDSLAVRALMRRLAADAQARSAGLDLDVGAKDPTIGDTLHVGQRLTLMIKASQDVTVALVHVMGDGTTHIWVPASPQGVCTTTPQVRADTPTELCSWPGSTAPYGLDLIYVIAAEGRSEALAGLTDAELTPATAKVLEEVVARHPRRVAIAEVPLFTAEGGL